MAGEPPRDAEHIRDWCDLAVASGASAEARATAARLVRAVPPHRLRRLDFQMRERSSYAPGPASTRWGEALFASRGPDRWPLLGLLSMVRDGRIRERAVRALLDGPDGDVNHFLLLRADDWVPQVREPAERAISERMNTERGPALLAVLPVLWDRFMSTESWGRSSNLVASIRTWLEAPAQRALLWDGARASDPWVARMCVSILLQSDDVVALYRAVGQSKDLLVSSWTGLACLRDDTAAEQVIDDLLDSRFGVVREAAAFWALRHRDDPVLLERLMFDRLTRVRFQAQHFLLAEGSDPARWYRDRLPDSKALTGIADVATDEDLETGLTELTSEAAERRAAAAGILRRISVPRAHQALVGAIADRTPGVSRRAADGVRSQGVVAEDMDRLIEIAQSDSASHVARNIRRSLVDSTRWIRLLGALTLLALSRDAENEGHILLDRTLRSWERSFTEPTEAELRQVHDSLDALRPLHETLVARVEDVIARYGST